jgi:hypothetical protein
MILNYTPEDILSAKDTNVGRLTAFDWSVIRNNVDPVLLKKLYEKTGSSHLVDLDFPLLCEMDMEPVLVDGKLADFVKTIEDLKEKLNKIFEEQSRQR